MRSDKRFHAQHTAESVSLVSFIHREPLADNKIPRGEIIVISRISRKSLGKYLYQRFFPARRLSGRPYAHRSSKPIIRQFLFKNNRIRRTNVYLTQNGTQPRKIKGTIHLTRDLRCFNARSTGIYSTIHGSPRDRRSSRSGKLPVSNRTTGVRVANPVSTRLHASRSDNTRHPPDIQYETANPKLSSSPSPVPRRGVSRVAGTPASSTEFIASSER